jgi:ABC-2 type transport system ATP-binding protein
MADFAVQIRGVCKKYRHFTLGPVDLEVPEGRVLGLIGPNGAGKSTLLRILIGLVRSDAGDVRMLGRDMPADEVAIKARTAFVSDDMALYGAATLRWHMNWVAHMAGGWDPALAASLLSRLQLNPDQKIRGASRGQQVKALLLLALSRRPELLLLDEPTTGLDPLVRRDLIRLLTDSRRDRHAMIFSSHQTDDVEGLADDVAFIHGGRVIAHGPVSTFVGSGRGLEAAFLAHVDAWRERGAA